MTILPVVSGWRFDPRQLTKTTPTFTRTRSFLSRLLFFKEQRYLFANILYFLSDLRDLLVRTRFTKIKLNRETKIERGDMFLQSVTQSISSSMFYTR